MKALVRNCSGKSTQWRGAAGPWKLNLSALIPFPNVLSYPRRSPQSSWHLRLWSQGSSVCLRLLPNRSGSPECFRVACLGMVGATKVLLMKSVSEITCLQFTSRVIPWEGLLSWRFWGRKIPERSGIIWLILKDLFSSYFHVRGCMIVVAHSGAAEDVTPLDGRAENLAQTQFSWAGDQPGKCDHLQDPNPYCVPWAWVNVLRSLVGACLETGDRISCHTCDRNAKCVFAAILFKTCLCLTDILRKTQEARKERKHAIAKVLRSNTFPSVFIVKSESDWRQALAILPQERCCNSTYQLKMHLHGLLEPPYDIMWPSSLSLSSSTLCAKVARRRQKQGWPRRTWLRTKGESLFPRVDPHWCARLGRKTQIMRSHNKKGRWQSAKARNEEESMDKVEKLEEDKLRMRKNRRILESKRKYERRGDTRQTRNLKRMRRRMRRRNPAWNGKNRQGCWQEKSKKSLGENQNSSGDDK